MYLNKYSISTFLYVTAPKNGISSSTTNVSSNHIKNEKPGVDTQLEGESISQMTSHLLDMTLVTSLVFKSLYNHALKNAMKNESLHDKRA